MSQQSLTARVRRINRYRKQLAQMEQSVEAAVRRAFPAGSPIQWSRGGHRQTGHVVQHGYGQKLLVYNNRTEHEIWITVFDVCEAFR